MIFNFVFILYRGTATSWSQTGYSEKWRQHIFRLRRICTLGCQQEPQVQGSEGGAVWVENGLTCSELEYPRESLGCFQSHLLEARAG